MEALGGVLKAKMSQDSVKMGPRTRQERNPRELPSGLSPPSPRSEVQRALWGMASGGARPGLSSFLRKTITRKKILPTVLNTPMTHQGGLADFGACAATGRAVAFSFSFDEKPTEAPSYALE